MDNQNPTPSPTETPENIPAQNPVVQESPAPQTHTAPQSSPPSSKSSFSTKIILLIVFLLILLGTGGTYLALNSKNKPTPVVSKTNLTPSPTEASAKVGTPIDETANWKTYTNKALGYSIKYPPNWNVYSFKDYPYSGYPGVIDPTRTIITSFPKFPRLQADGITDQYSGIDIFLAGVGYERIENVIKRSKKPDSAGNTTTIEKLTLSNVTAYKETRSISPNGYLILIPYPNKPGIIVPGWGAIPDEKTFNQILSTFRFD